MSDGDLAKLIEAVVDAAERAGYCLAEWMPSSDAVRDECERINAAVNAYRDAVASKKAAK